MYVERCCKESQQGIRTHPPRPLDGSSVEIKHPITQEFKRFFIPQKSLGFLREGSPTGPRLPPFSSRGDVDQKVPLNPILVNFAAMVRLSRLIHQSPEWESGLDAEVLSILGEAIRLHKAVIWAPRCHPESVVASIPTGVPGSEQDEECLVTSHCQK